MKPLMNHRTEIAVQAALSNFSGVVGLFGEAGSGKLTLARYIVSQLTGKAPPSLANWPYIFVLDGDGAGIEAVRDLQKFLQLTVPGDKQLKRAVILENIDQSSTEAQNALLKTIEEPPADTVMVLTATSELSVLPTILSRITRIPVLPVSKSSLALLGIDLSQSEIDRLYNLSEGRIGTFAGLAQGDTAKPDVLAIESAKELLGLSRAERLSRVDSLIKSKKLSPIELVDGILKIHRAVLSSRLHSDASKKEIIQALTNITSANTALVDLNSGVHAKLALTRLFIS